MTELEACVLAVIWRQGPMTAYQVRREFERSPASSWRASTGSIYPLIKRLRAQELAEADAAPQDGRGTTLISVSEKGRTKVTEWLTAMPPWIGDVSEDPIRTRIQFLMLLNHEERLQAATEMLAATQSAAENMIAFINTLAQHSLERLAHEGALAILLARLNWLASVKAHFAQPSASA